MVVVVITVGVSNGHGCGRCPSWWIDIMVVAAVVEVIADAAGDCCGGRQLW